jgi:hypothetical protein
MQQTEDCLVWPQWEKVPNPTGIWCTRMEWYGGGGRRPLSEVKDRALGGGTLRMGTRRGQHLGYKCIIFFKFRKPIQQNKECCSGKAFPLGVEDTYPLASPLPWIRDVMTSCETQSRPLRWRSWFMILPLSPRQLHLPQTPPYRNHPQTPPYRNHPQTPPYRNHPQTPSYRNHPQTLSYRNHSCVSWTMKAQVYRIKYKFSVVMIIGN